MRSVLNCAYSMSRNPLTGNRLWQMARGAVLFSTTELRYYLSHEWRCNSRLFPLFGPAMTHFSRVIAAFNWQPVFRAFTFSYHFDSSANILLKMNSIPHQKSTSNHAKDTRLYSTGVSTIKYSALWRSHLVPNEAYLRRQCSNQHVPACIGDCYFVIGQLLIGQSSQLRVSCFVTALLQALDDYIYWFLLSWYLFS